MKNTSIFATAIVAITVGAPETSAQEAKIQALYEKYQDTFCLQPRKKPTAFADQSSPDTQKPDHVKPDQDERKNADYLLGVQGFGDPIGNIAIPDNEYSGADREETGVTDRASLLSPQLETSTEDSRASIGWNHTASYGGGGLFSYGLNFSAPLAKSGDTELSRFGSFSSDAKLSASFSRFSPLWKLKGGSNHQAAREQEQFAKLEEAIDKECPASDDPEENSDCKEKRILLSKLSSENMLVSSNCTYRPTSSSFQAVPSVFYGGSFSVGYQSFQFKDPMTFASTTDDKTPWSAELYIGLYSRDRSALMRAGYTRVENYKAADNGTRCREDEEQMGLVCDTAAFAGPQDDTQDVGFLEYRRKLGGDNPSIVKAASLKLSYDFSSNEPEIDLPIYLFNGSDGALNGGLRATWSEENNAVIGIFIGSKFSIDPN